MVVLAMRWEGSNDIYLIGQEIEKKEKKKKKINITIYCALLQYLHGVLRVQGTHSLIHWIILDCRKA